MISSPLSFQIYWEFEALLNAANTAIDMLTRIAGLASQKQVPITFSKLLKKEDPSEIINILASAKEEWIDRMKNYRDCFVHCTPVDSRVYVVIYRLSKSWKMWCKIPTNPNARDPMSYKFSKKVDLLRYAHGVYHNLISFEAKLSIKIEELYNNGEYPMRINKLFSMW